MSHSVTYASYCCAKDLERFTQSQYKHIQSHAFDFNEVIFVFQRCGLPPGGFIQIPKGYLGKIKPVQICEESYPKILMEYRIKWPDEDADKWTHGWASAHYWAHHCVNHLRAAQVATSEYIVFADGDCHMKKQPKGKSWIDEGISILESDPKIFVVSPSDGRPDPGPDRIMSQQCFLIRRLDFLGIEFIEWDGTMPFGPMAEYYFMLEGRIDRHMRKHNLFRYVLPIEYRYWHGEWH